jgi:PKD repeat protein
LETLLKNVDFKKHPIKQTLNYITQMKKLIAITTLLLSVLSTASAQHWCGTMNHSEKLNSERPEIEKEVERKFKEFNNMVHQNEAKGVKNSNHFVIPVVFHVIHKGGSENISFEQIEDQMRSLNEDFAYMNADSTNTPDAFKPYTTNTNIEFRLAQIDPDGNCTQGVTRTLSNLTSSGNDNVKELIQWDPFKYFNVWVVNDIDRDTDYGRILGYAQFPEQLWSNPETDGVIMLDSYCGSIGTASNQVGRTLTHEAGHWLDLRHIWGDGDGCQSDQVNDTPTAEEPNFGVCTANFPYKAGTNQGCPTESTNQIISQEFGEMFMNYMDYSDDACMNMFTVLQGERMQAAISEYRSILVSEDNLIATGTNDGYTKVVCAPTPEFKSDYTYGCPGDAYSFFNTTYNIDYALDSIVNYEWTFEGGSPSTSNAVNPENILFENSGFFNVSLTATNSGGLKTLVKESYITVTDDENNMDFPYIEDFGYSGFPTYPIENESRNWVISPQIDPTWEKTTESYSDALRIRSATFSREGDRHTIITPTIDLSEATAPVNAYFDLAYARKNMLTDDVLRVYISQNCGRTWITKRTLSNESLITNDGSFVFLPFVPAEDEWQTEKVSLSTLAGEKNIQIKLEFIGENGNWLYIDNFIVCKEAELALTETILKDLNIYPNPSKGDVTIEFELYKEATVGFAVSNIFGATVAKEEIKLNPQNNRIQLKNLYPNIKAGIYFIQLNYNETTITKKVVITD